MEISTGKINEGNGGLFEQIEKIADKNSPEYRSKIRELETALGIKEVNRFGTANRTIFEENINELGMIELQAYARKMKVDSSGSMAAIRTRLLKQFDTQNGQSRGHFSPQPQTKEMFTREQKEQLGKILNG
jgi:hypothetical protein